MNSLIINNMEKRILTNLAKFGVVLEIIAIAIFSYLIIFG